MAFPISGERDTYSVNRGETSYHGEQIKINSNLTQKLQMKGEGIRGKRKVLIMDSGPCTLHLYASIQFHLLPVFPLLTLITVSFLLFCGHSKDAQASGPLHMLLFSLC